MMHKVRIMANPELPQPATVLPGIQETPAFLFHRPGYMGTSRRHAANPNTAHAHCHLYSIFLRFLIWRWPRE